MPPKKVAEPERKPLIGRVGTNLRVGIVGVPNVGKSTFFNAITRSAAPAENFPFCTIDPNENNELGRFACDPHVLIEKAGLHLVRGHAFEEPEEPQEADEWYPLVNSYYEFAEDFDAVNRIPHLLHEVYEKESSSSSCSGSRSVGSVPQRMPAAPRRDHMVERLAQVRFLQTPPACFLITGKPGLDGERLGRRLAQTWGCVYIDPEALLREEIAAESRSGLCLDFNLRCGRAIDVDVLVHLLHRRLAGDDVQHCGFALCGWPLHRNDLYAQDEPAFTPADIFEGESRTFASELTQMAHVFELLQPFDYYLIYVKCHNAEVVNIRRDHRLDARTLVPENLQPERRVDDDDHLLDDRKRLKLQRHFPAHVREQLGGYMEHAQLAIERQILLLPPDKIIRLDGRMPPDQLWQVVRARLRILNLNPVPLPSRLVMPADPMDPMVKDAEEEEEEEEDEGDALGEDLRALPLEEAFEILARRNTLAPRYKWTLSNWTFLCPVALHAGERVTGHADLAVQFLNAVFFLSSEERLQAFVRNPRPFLLPPLPIAHRSFFVLGTSKRGNASIAHFLHCVTGARICSYPLEKLAHVQQQRQSILDEVEERTRRSTLNELKQRRQQAYLQSESDRLSKLQEYKTNLRHLVGMREGAVVEDERIPEALREPDVFTYDVVGPRHEDVVAAVEKAVRDRAESLKTEPFDAAAFVNALIDGQNARMRDGETSGWIIVDVPASAAFLDLVDAPNRPDLTVLVDQMVAEGDMADEAADCSREERERVMAQFGVASVGLERCAQPSPSTETLSEEGDLPGDYDEIVSELRARDQEVLRLELGEQPFASLLAEILEHLLAQMTPPARQVTHDEKVQEVFDYMDELGDGHHSETEEEEQGEGEELRAKSFREQRRLGCTSEYDPVAFAQHGVLWRGSEEHLVAFGNTRWLFATADTMAAFVRSPLRFARHSTLNRPLPPVRICVVGIPRAGKTTQARRLSARLGLYYCDFEQEFRARHSANAFAGYLSGVVDEAAIVEVLDPLWSRADRKLIGFVLDGFPRRPKDIDVMCQHYLIPDCFVELRIAPSALHDRLLHLEMAEWRLQRDRHMSEKRSAFEEEIARWNEEKAAFQERMLLEQPAEEDMLQTMFPEPALLGDWEPEDAAEVRLRRQIEAGTGRAPEDVAQLHLDAIAASIPWHNVDASMDGERVYNRLMLDVMAYKFRTRSLFERAYDLSPEMAERLLLAGYAFLSRFGRLCPVQALEQRDSLPTFTHLEDAGQLCPLLYRSYVLFLSGPEARDRFRADILKYMLQPFEREPQTRVRLAVIGPPRSGKTTLSTRFASAYALQRISIGSAVRHVLEQMPSSVLARTVRAALDRGDEVPLGLAVECGEALTFSARAVAVGYVLDGFPSTPAEARALAQSNLLPHLVLDLAMDLATVFQYMRFFARADQRPAYGRQLIKYRFDEWSMGQAAFRQWLDAEYQNRASVQVACGRWGVWTRADQLARAAVARVKDYYRNANAWRDTPLRVAQLLVTPQEFVERQGEFQHHCPVCLHRDNQLSADELPPDRAGLLAFRGRFYWLCALHVDEFVADAERFLGPHVRHSLPMTLPAAPANVYRDGVCVVCLVRHRPDLVLRKGSPSLALGFGRFRYLFDTRACLRAFQADPYAFAPTNEMLAQYDQGLDMRSLPALGMLEQFVAAQVVAAVAEVERMRPQMPGLSVTQSALVALGLCLKLANPRTPRSQLAAYATAKCAIVEHVSQMQALISECTSTINPYIHYEEPLPPVRFVSERLPPATPRPSDAIASVMADLLHRVCRDSSEDEFQLTDL